MKLPYDEIIVNGDSYSAPVGIVYGNVLSEKLNIPVTNIAAAGSNNDRITRSTIEQVLSKLNTSNRLLVIVGWSFIRRIEVWYYGTNQLVNARIHDKNSSEPHKNPKFVTLDVLSQLNEITLEQKCLINEDLFVHKQLTDFYSNVYLLSQFLQNNSVDYLFFSAAKNVEVPVHCFPYIENLQQVQKVIQDPRILDLHNFYISDWASKNDPEANPTTGHLSTTGHAKFSEVLLEKLNDIQSHQTTQIRR